MGLEIYSSDLAVNFRIGYIGFLKMRELFVLSYDESLYNFYHRKNTYLDWKGKEWEHFCDKLNDLSILINHSDCCGELTSEECKKLEKCLQIDDDKIIEKLVLINGTQNTAHCESMINKMYDFKKIIQYCAENENVELIFA